MCAWQPKKKKPLYVPSPICWTNLTISTTMLAQFALYTRTYTRCSLCSREPTQVKWISVYAIDHLVSGCASSNKKFNKTQNVNKPLTFSFLFIYLLYVRVSSSSSSSTYSRILHIENMPIYADTHTHTK